MTQRDASRFLSQPAMKTIGILGGMSTASTLQYYEYMCELVQNRLGGLHSPRLLIRSVDFGVMNALLNDGAWTAIGERLAERACELETGGAEILVLATNTMHKVTPRMMRDVNIPLIHIVDATADRILKGGFAHPGFIGTGFTMQDSFYLDRLRARGLQPIVPSGADQEVIHRIIFEELCRHDVDEQSRKDYERISRALKREGADCLVLGCTEVGLLLGSDNAPLPVFDTTKIHCEAAIAAAFA